MPTIRDTNVRVITILLMVVAGCGSPDGRVAGSPSRTDEASSDPNPDEPSVSEEERRDVIARAEAFVLAQGYADAPPSVPEDEIVHEFIEGPIETRLHSLRPRALRAVRRDGRWVVLFAYQRPTDPDNGRALILRDGEAPRFAHQDAILSAW